MEPRHRLVSEPGPAPNASYAGDEPRRICRLSALVGGCGPVEGGAVGPGGRWFECPAELVPLELTEGFEGFEAFDIVSQQLEPALARGLGHGASRGVHFLARPPAIVTDVGFHLPPSPRAR